MLVEIHKLLNLPDCGEEAVGFEIHLDNWIIKTRTATTSSRGAEELKETKFGTSTTSNQKNNGRILAFVNRLVNIIRTCLSHTQYNFLYT